MFSTMPESMKYAAEYSDHVVRPRYRNSIGRKVIPEVLTAFFVLINAKKFVNSHSSNLEKTVP
jgi:hypothetical protein